MSNEQVWEIIKGFDCADLKIVVDPAIAVWNHQQSKIEQLEKKLKAVEEIMNDYYTGSFEDAPEMAGWISTALRGDYENQD